MSDPLKITLQTKERRLTLEYKHGCHSFEEMSGAFDVICEFLTIDPESFASFHAEYHGIFSGPEDEVVEPACSFCGGGLVGEHLIHCPFAGKCNVCGGDPDSKVEM